MNMVFQQFDPKTSSARKSVVAHIEYSVGNHAIGLRLSCLQRLRRCGATSIAALLIPVGALCQEGNYPPIRINNEITIVVQENKAHVVPLLPRGNAPVGGVRPGSTQTSSSQNSESASVSRSGAASAASALNIIGFFTRIYGSSRTESGAYNEAQEKAKQAFERDPSLIGVGVQINAEVTRGGDSVWGDIKEFKTTTVDGNSREQVMYGLYKGYNLVLSDGFHSLVFITRDGKTEQISRSEFERVFKLMDDPVTGAAWTSEMDAWRTEELAHKNRLANVEAKISQEKQAGKDTTKLQQQKAKLIAENAANNEERREKIDRVTRYSELKEKGERQQLDVKEQKEFDKFFDGMNQALYPPCYDGDCEPIPYCEVCSTNMDILRSDKFLGNYRVLQERSGGQTVMRLFEYGRADSLAKFISRDSLTLGTEFGFSGFVDGISP
jgi:hypothetical protein